MTSRFVICERAADTAIPLFIIAFALTLMGKGFDTLMPVIACLTFSVLQPFVRVFVFDRVRLTLLEANRPLLLLTGALLIYGLLAAVVAQFFLS